MAAAQFTDKLILDGAGNPVPLPLKRPLEISAHPSLYEHTVSTAGLYPESFLTHAQRLANMTINNLEVLLNFVASNDEQLLTLAQLPLAHTLLKSFSNLLSLKKNEFAKPAPYPYSFVSCDGPPAKIRRTPEISWNGPSPSPSPYIDTPLHTSPHFFQKPFPFQPPSDKLVAPPNRLPQPSPVPLASASSSPTHLVLPEGKLHSNPTSLEIDWSKTCISNFEILGELGNGAFGSVRLCREKDTGVLFCVKILDRNKIRYLKQREHIINERTIMFSVNHPFIVKLFCTFKSPSCLFFLMEFIAGGELFNYIRAEGQFTHITTKLVAAEIILALQYLHNQDIIYRDIKPENVLVDHQGHLKLTDFGFAKHIEERTNSMCGTLDYMAPEIIMAKGHGKPADWWSLGILIYEMLSGCPPLPIESVGNHSMHLIAAGKLEFPSYFDPLAVDLIKKLLVIDEKDRLGSRNGAEDLKRHPWFSDVNWGGIIRRESPGPLASLKSFKLHIGSPHGDFTNNDINLREEIAKAGPSKTGSFEGFEGYRIK